jgi:hypothetical protein
MSEAVDLLNSQGYSYESFISYIEEIGGSEEDVLKIWKNSPNNSDYDEFYNYFWYVTEDDYLEIYYENAFEIEYWQQATMDDLLTLIESYEITMEEFASTFSFWSFEEMENDIEGFFGSDIATLIAAFDSTDETYFESLFEFATLDDSEDAWIKDFMIEATEFSDVEYIYENYAFDIESCQRDIDRKIQAKMFTQPALKKWLIFHGDRDSQIANSFSSTMKQCLDQVKYESCEP